MADWKQIIKGEDYHGPTDETVYEHVTMFGLRDGCMMSEVERQFGTHRLNVLTQSIDALVTEGRLKVIELRGGNWIKKTN